MAQDLWKNRYRLGVGVVLLSPQNQIFVAERLDSSGAWQMPQGGVDSGEELLDAMYRELEEETSIPHHAIDVVKESQGYHSYDFPDHLRHKIMRGKFQGQKQKWYLARFMGSESLINVQTRIPEFSRWRWSDPASVPLLIVPFKEQLYRAILSEFDLLAS